MVQLKSLKLVLLANATNQQEGVDFTETFSPVVKPATICTVLSLAFSHHWTIRQLDAWSSFRRGLYGATSRFS